MSLKEDIRKRPSVSVKWRKVKDIMATHLQGAPPEVLFRARRPLESSNEYAMTYRVDNFQPITKQPFATAVGAIIETAGHVFAEETGVDDNTKEFVDDLVLKAAGKSYKLKDYIIKYVGRMAESDPNAVLVTLPRHPTEEFIPDWREELPNFDSIQNEFVDLQIQLVSSDLIQHIDSEQIVFEGGQYLYFIDEQQEYYEPFYYIVDADSTSLIVPYRKDKTFEYKVVPFYANGLEVVPFDVIGYNSVIEQLGDEYVEYMESTYSGAVAIGNEVLGVKSDEQICTTRFTYPEKFMQMERCAYPGCIQCADPDSPYAGLFVNYGNDSTDSPTCSVCESCNGIGKVAPDTSPLGTHFISKSDSFDDNGKFVPPITFVTPPLESPQYLDDKWRKDFDQMEQALFITKQNMTNQSGESKSYSVKQKVSVLTAAVKNIYTIYENSLNTIQGYLRGDPDVVIHLPPDFNIKTSQDITIELADAKNTSSVYTSELTRELLLKKFGNDATTRKMVDFLELNDKLWGFTMDEIVKAKAIYGKDLTIRDQVIHDKGLAVLKMLARAEGFETISDEKLQVQFNEAIDNLLGLSEEEEAISDDPLAQLEAEAKSKLKGTVGGVQGIISINQAVADGTMSEASAEVMLVQIYGLPIEIAEKLIEKGVPVPPIE